MGAALTITFWQPGRRSIDVIARDAGGRWATASWTANVVKTTERFDGAFYDLLDRGFGEPLIRRIEEVSGAAGVQVDAREAARLIVLGGLCGEVCFQFGVDGSDSSWYFIGWVAVGTFVPVFEFIADGRDTLGCLASNLANMGCGTDDLIINGLATIPWYLIGSAVGPKGTAIGATAGFGIDVAQATRKLERLRRASPEEAGKVDRILIATLPWPVKYRFFEKLPESAQMSIFADEMGQLRRHGFGEDKATTLVLDVFAANDEPSRIVGIIEGLAQGTRRDRNFVEAIRGGQKTGIGVIAELDVYEGLKAQYRNGRARAGCPPFKFGVVGGESAAGMNLADFMIPGCRCYSNNIHLEVYRKQTPSWEDFANRIAKGKAEQVATALETDKYGFGVVVADVRAYPIDSASAYGGADNLFAKALRDARAKYGDHPLKGIRVVYKDDSGKERGVTYYWDDAADAARKKGSHPWEWERDFNGGERLD